MLSVVFPMPSFWRSDAETAASRPAEFSARSLWKDTSREGFMAMILDVSAQMPATVGIRGDREHSL